VTYIYLFIAFFKIGLFSIGGGLATLPFLFELADNSGGLLTREMVGNMLAVAQSSPGAIGVNLSSYVGLTLGGIPGGCVAALGLVSPSIIVIIIVARMLRAFRENVIVKNLFAGLRPAASGLLSAACLGAVALSLRGPAASVWYEYLRWKETLMFAVIFVLIIKFRKHPAMYIAAAGIAGVVLKL